MSPKKLAKWKVFIARTMYLVLGFAEQRSFSEMLPSYVLTFETTVTLAGWAFTVMTGMSYLLAPLIRILIEETSLRLFAIVGAIFYGASFIVLGLFGHNIWHVFVLHALAGFSSASVNLATYLALGEHFEKKFGLANSAAFLIAALVGILFPLLLLYLELSYGFRWTLMLYGAIAWNTIATGIWVTSKSDHIDNESDRSPSNVEQNPPPSLPRAHWTILFLFGFYVVTYVISTGFSLILYPFGLEKGLDVDSSALLISWYSIGSILGRVYVFAMFKLNLETTRIVVVLPILLELAMQLASISSSNGVLVGLGAFFVGFSTGSMITWGSSIVREFTCEIHFSSAAAWLTASGGIGSTFAGLWTGWIHDIQGSYQHVMISYIGLNITQLLLALTVLTFSRETDCHVSPASSYLSDTDVSDGLQSIEMEEICSERWEQGSSKGDEQKLCRDLRKQETQQQPATLK